MNYTHETLLLACHVNKYTNIFLGIETIKREILLPTAFNLLKTTSPPILFPYAGAMFFY